MKIRKIMLVSIVLLAILTIGAVSAGDDTDFNETLTADNVEEASADASLNEEIMSEDSDDLIASSEDDNLKDSVGEDNLHPWVSSHEMVTADWDPWIVNVHGDDNVQNGSVELEISKDNSSIFTDEKSFEEDSDECNDIVWSLNYFKDKGVFNDAGTYNVALKYSNDDVNFDLGNYTFQLTNLNFNCEEDVAVNNPFDVIRIWEENHNALVYVEGSKKETEKNNPLRWSLSDLEIEQAGEYSIRIETYDENNNFIEQYEYVLKVRDFNESDFAVFSNVYEIFDVENPVILIYLPQSRGGEFSISVNGEKIKTLLEFTDNWAELTLNDLGISQNEGYNVLITYADDENPDGFEIFNRDLYVSGFINENSFDPWVSSHEPVTADWNPQIVNIHGHDVISEGNVVLTITNSEGDNKTYYKSFEDDADENNEVVWELDELTDILNSPGVYTFDVVYEGEITLINDFSFTLTQLNYNTCEGDIYFKYPFDIIRVWDEDIDVRVYVNDNDEPFTSSVSDPYRWTLEDLNIDATGEYNITIRSFDGDGNSIENLTFTLNLYDEINGFEFITPMDVQTWNMEGEVLYLLCPDDSMGKTLTLSVNDEYDFDVTVEDNWIGFTLEDLNIDYDESHNIKLYDGDEYICDVWLNVWCIDQNKIRTWVWDSEKDGKLYTDYGDKVISVEVPEGKEGFIKVYVDDDEVISWEIDNDYNEWTLDDLGIIDADEYNITVKYVDYEENEENLAEATWNILEFDGNQYRAEIDFNNREVRFYCIDGVEGTVKITVETYDEDEDSFEVVDEFEYDLDDDYYSQWTVFTFNQLNVPLENNIKITVEVDDSDEGYTYDRTDYLEALLDVDTFNLHDEGIIYSDVNRDIFSVELNENAESGTLEVLVNDNTKFNTLVYSNTDYRYAWTLNHLGITEPGNYTVTFILTTDSGAQETHEFTFELKEFDNATFRAILDNHAVEDDGISIYFFCPDNANGTITLTLREFSEEDDEWISAGEFTYEINSTMYNKWTLLKEVYGLDYEADFVVDDDSILVETSSMNAETNSSGDDDDDNRENFDIVFDKNFESADDTVVYISIPFYNASENLDFNISCGNDEIFSINLIELKKRQYEWGMNWDGGFYYYAITLDDLNSFDSVSDKDVLTFYLNIGDKAKRYSGSPTELASLEKSEGTLMLHGYEALRIDLIKIELAHDEEDEEEEVDEDESSSQTSEKDNQIIKIKVPDSLKIHETARVHIAYRDLEIIKNISELYNEYDYGYLGVNYYITWDDLDLTSLENNDFVNVSVTSNNETFGFNQFVIYFDDEEGWGIDYYSDSVDLTFYYGHIGSLEFGQGERSYAIIELGIPEYLNITEGTILITDDNGEIIFSRFVNTSEWEDTDKYVISDDDFDYSIFEENVPFTVSFSYENTTKIFAKGVRQGDELHRITTLENIRDLFKVTLSEGILINGSDRAIIIEATDNANRQSIHIDLGGGYFVVYVNGKKIENLGSIIGYYGENELTLFILQQETKVYVYLSDLNITDNGAYNIRVTHQPETGETSSNIEVEMYNQNITLTSNVKVDNVTSDVLTGFGMDPILLYLDTYYGDINDTTGVITVLNSEGDEILKSNIKELSKDENGRYYLKYSDFTNKNFGDEITVMYGEGNERSGNTTVNVTWKDVNATDFTPALNNNVSDYYGDFIDMTIPALLDQGQIIVTIKFKNQHTSSISNINVTTDFDSQAVYVFNVADIGSGNNLKLAMSDLGFYETDGNYDVQIQFTAGENTLDVANSTMDVKLLEQILLTINDTSRYTIELPFAGVRIFEPLNAYAELYIDGALYSRKVFSDGLITFTSSPLWTCGTHNASLVVYDSEFGVILNSSEKTFEVLAKSDDVSINVPENVRENAVVNLTVNVAKAGNVTVWFENNTNITQVLVPGTNNVDLRILPHGNRTVYVLYESEDGTSFFNDNLSFFVGDDGRWLNFPETIILNDQDTVKIDFGPGAKGTVSIYIDDKFINNITLTNGAASFTIDETYLEENFNGEDLLGAAGSTSKYGKHNYTIRYSGDDTHDEITRYGEFTVAYIFKDDMASEGYPLREDYEFEVELPADANGTVKATVENQVLTSEVVNGKASFRFNNLGMGDHQVLVEYMGDEKYPYASYQRILSVSYYAVVGKYDENEKYISLWLPENATGNLTIENENMREVLASIPLKDGKATFSLTDMTVGIYEIKAYYDGNDTDVRQFNIQFRVAPKVDIKQGIVMGDNGNIYLDLDNATGDVVIAMDGLSPVVQHIENGIVNYTFSTEGYFHGNHSVTFLYFGKSFDGYIFYEEDGRTQIQYNLLVLPQKTTGNLSSDGGNYAEARIYDADGNLATDAEGTVTFFVNGVKVAVVDIVNGIARLDISKYKNGKYLIKWEYSGDSKYASSSGQSDVDKKPAKITAGDLTALYSSSKKYSVTVKNPDGSIAGNVDVKFSINGKAVKTVMTDSKGVAILVISQKPGNYKITTTALGTSTTKTLKVTHVLSLKKVKVKKSAKKLVIKATLKKVNGKYIKGKKVTLKFNGKKYTAKTNKKGVVKFTIKKSVLKKLKAGKKVKYQATYLKDTVKKTVKVKK